MIRQDLGVWKAIQPDIEIFQWEDGPTDCTNDETIDTAANRGSAVDGQNQLQVISQKRQHRHRRARTDTDFNLCEIREHGR